jgi:dTDP-4-dehydrorhamnose reductase
MLRLARQGKSLRIVSDQRCTPTYTRHLAAALAFLIAEGAEGLFHIVNGGETNWYEFACEIFKQAGLNPEIAGISAAEYGAAAQRPSYSVLDTTKYHRLGGPVMPDWRTALGEYLAERETAERERAKATP